MESRFNFYEIFFLEQLKNPTLFWREITSQWQIGLSPQETGNLLFKYQLMTPGNKQEVVDKLRDLQILKSFPLSEFLKLLRRTGNDILADFMAVNPDQVSIGGLSWETVIYDLWPDLGTLVDYEELSSLLCQTQSVFSYETDAIAREVYSNEERVAKLICLVAERMTDLDILQKILYFIGTKKRGVVALADFCSPCDLNQMYWLEEHRDVFIAKVDNIAEIALFLHQRSFLNSLDLQRFEKIKSSRRRAKFIVNIMERRSGPGMVGLINACSQTGNEDMAIMMSIQPNEIALSRNALLLVQFNWKLIVETVQYDHIMKYLIAKNYLPYKEHLRMIGKENRDKIREILKLVLTREEFYEAFFNIISLQVRYDHIFKMSFPMDYEERYIFLEVQDFLALNMDNVDLICEKLTDFDLLTPSDLELVERMPTVLKRNQTICNILKTKSMGTVLRFRDVLWNTNNRDCAEILSVDFRNFKMALEEWNKLKTNWIKITKCVQWESVAPTLVSTSILNEREVAWIEKSAKNRQKIRKLLRLLPAKERGYRILLLALSQYEEHFTLLMQCQPMDIWRSRRLELNEEFLIENTSMETLPQILSVLKEKRILTELEEELITFYEEPIQELYILLRGKNDDVIEELIKALQLTGNFDAAAVLNIDLFSIKLSPVEWSDYLRMWLDFIDEIKYQSCRTYFVSSGLISSIEDEYISTEPDNERQMRLLLQVLPYRQDSLQALVQMMM